MEGRDGGPWKNVTKSHRDPFSDAERPAARHAPQSRILNQTAAFPTRLLPPAPLRVGWLHIRIGLARTWKGQAWQKRVGWPEHGRGRLGRSE